MTCRRSPAARFFGAASRPYRGHVTLMKRGEDMSAMIQNGWSPPVVIAACSSTGKTEGGRYTWDQATLKTA